MCFCRYGNGVDMVTTDQKTLSRIGDDTFDRHGNIPDGVQAIKNWSL